MTFTSRPFQEDDYESHIESLIEENMKQLFISNFGGWSKEVSERKFLDIAEFGFVEVFFEDHKFIGYVSVGPEKNDEHSYLIHDIHLVKEFQRKGYGKKILEFVEKKAQENNKVQLVAFVFKNNPAVDFYLHEGFIDSGRGKTHSLVVIKKLDQ